MKNTHSIDDAQEILDFIYHDSYKFNPEFHEKFTSWKPGEAKKLATHLDNHEYNVMLYGYGLRFLNSVYRYYVQEEMYEECALIRDVINQHNEYNLENQMVLIT